MEMYSSGDILRKEDLVDPTSGRLSQLFKTVVSLMGISSPAPEFVDDCLVLKTLLEVSIEFSFILCLSFIAYNL